MGEIVSEPSGELGRLVKAENLNEMLIRPDGLLCDVSTQLVKLNWSSAKRHVSVSEWQSRGLQLVALEDEPRLSHLVD